MLKKLKSKRGFTIIEVMVAFVIFAIMAAMVSTILQQTMMAKQENVDLEDEITNQEQIYYQKKQEPKDKYNASDSHNLSLDFKDKTDAETANLSVDYSLGDPNADVGVTDNDIALNYMAANLSYDKKDAQPNTNTDPKEGSVHSRLNSAIYGSNGIDTIKLYMKKAPEDESDGKNRYYIGMQLTAKTAESGKAIPDYIRAYAQVRLVFPAGNAIERCGLIYAKKSTTDNSFVFEKATAPNSGYEAMKTTTSILRIASTSLNTTGQYSLLEKDVNNPIAGVYVDLSAPLSDTYLNSSTGAYDLNKLFGYSDDDKTSNATGDGVAYIFTPYVGKVYDSKGNVVEENGTYPNIFAGSQKAADSTTKDEGTDEASDEAPEKTE